MDRLGVWLSARQIRRLVRAFRDKKIADLGCGHQAAFTRTVLGDVRRAVLVDVATSQRT